MSQIFEGRMFTFHKDPYRRIPVFLSGSADRCLVWVGGQGDGLFSIGYMGLLINELSSSWTVAQWTPASSFLGYGAQCHNRDAEDLDELIGILVTEHGMKEIALFATSTGLQLALEVLARGRYRDHVSRVILQGIISDPKGPMFTSSAIYNRQETASKLLAAGRGDDMAAMEGVYDIPITPARVESGGYPSLQEALWLPAHNNDSKTIRDAMSVIRVPLLVMVSLHSDFTVSSQQQQAFENIVKSNCITPEVFISYFNDTSDERRRMLKASEAQHTAAIVFFLAEQDEKRRQREQAIAQVAADEERRNRSVLAKSNFAHRVQ